HGAQASNFGWHRDNYIGSTPQPNARTDSWAEFLREHRLGFQFTLAKKNGHQLGSADAGFLLQNLDAFYSDYQPRPSLLHGDLWGGNWFSDDSGAPVVFDPAVYCGDREADLAMTELFGGFGEDFYCAYSAAWALDPGYPVRRDLHKLYHVLNHLNLFGGGYLGQARQLINRLCAELR
ncbi:MAG: fructosamine kinase family protein, partial [Gammaproteobacteria bacterium]|nr:fructosamine kinase family protein [Gammaproteobacteria bacterium]